MAKRFTDTEKYKKAFYRKLPGAYKLFWDFICHDCDHAGIWHVDLEISQIYLGADMQVDLSKALELFNDNEERIVVINDGSKWFIRTFIEFQYGVLNTNNRVHASILSILQKNKIKPLTSPLKGAKDKDKDKDKDKVKDKVKEDLYEKYFNEFWELSPSRNGKRIDKPAAKEKFFKLKESDIPNVIIAIENYANSELVKKNIGIKDPHRFLNNRDNPEYWKEWIEPEVGKADKWEGFGDD